MFRNIMGICCFLLLLMFVSSLALASRPRIDAPYITHTINVDGDAADWTQIKDSSEGIYFYKGDHQKANGTKLGRTILKNISSEEDCRVDLWLCHDGTYLYVLAEVKDDDYEPFGNNNHNMAYLEDTLHLYIDSNNSRRNYISYPPIANQPGYEQFGISTDGNIYGENTDFTTSSVAPAPLGASPDGEFWQAECQVASLQDGSFKYTFEERISLAGRPGGNMTAMEPGNHYGFDAEFCDADNGEQLQGYIFWSSNGYTDAWNYEGLWGRMDLAPVPEPSGMLLFGIGGALFGWIRTKTGHANADRVH